MSANFFKSKLVFFYSAILFAALTSVDPFLHHEGPEEGHVLECQLCSNDFAETRINVGDSNNLNIETKHNAKGTFYVKYLLLFTKSTNLCTTVEIYLKNKFPLILVYNVANLGKLQYCLAPLVE